MIIRRLYLEKILPFIDKDIIKIITGVRRSGKSVFLHQLMDKIESENKIFINFEQTENKAFREDYTKLDAHLAEIIATSKGKTYLFFDEIQLMKDWQYEINSLKASYDVDIYLTGSNAQLLSGELATLLAGRYVSIEMFPFSYAEFLENSPEASFQDFLLIGGMPMASDYLDNSVSRQNVLEDIYNSVLLKDIVARYNIRDTDLLNRLLTYVFSEVGRVFSANSISNYLKNEKRSVSKDTIMNYLEACESAFLISSVPFEDTLGKKILNVNNKFYVIDHGIREALIGRNQQDIELVLENIVYYELLRRGYQVTVGRNGEKEIDFVAKKSGTIDYFQVSYLLADEKTRAREFGAYQGIDDNFPKYVLSMDKIDFSQNGILHQNIEKWLTAVM